MFFKKKVNYSEIKHANQSILYSPTSGEVIELENVNDTVFNSGMMGTGIGIKPKVNDITSPIEGEIVTVFPTKHAIGILGVQGEELLLHIGIETVALNGKYFTVNVKEGQRIKAGELIANVNFQKIAKEGYNTTVILVISNSESFDTKRIDSSINTEIQQPLLEIIKRDDKNDNK